MNLHPTGDMGESLPHGALPSRPEISVPRSRGGGRGPKSISSCEREDGHTGSHTTASSVSCPVSEVSGGEDQKARVSGLGPEAASPGCRDTPDARDVRPSFLRGVFYLPR